MLARRFFRLTSSLTDYRSLRDHLRCPVAILYLLLAMLTFAGCARSTIGEGKPVLRWWKGNLHTHTLWSDGGDYPEMVVEWYKKHGYHFLALSDHNILSQGRKWIDAADNRGGEAALDKYLDRFGQEWVEQRVIDDRLQVRLKPLSEFRCLFEAPDHFLLIQAEEITDKKAHLNVIHLRDVIQPQGGNTTLEVLQNNVNAVLDQRRDTGQVMFAQINHPNFEWALTVEDIMRVQGAGFWEVFNGHPQARNYGDQHRAGTERMWDIILTKRLAELDLPVIYGTANDDAHDYHKYGPEYANPGRGWLMLRAPHLTPESIIKAMETGDFYASTGVTLKDIQFDGKILRLTIKPEKGVSYTTQFIGTLKGYDPTSKPAVDENGNQIQTTRIYSDQIGRILAEKRGAVAGYNLTGNEIYVRAKVISTKPKDNPFAAGDVEVAWTQPVIPSAK